MELRRALTGLPQLRVAIDRQALAVLSGLVRIVGYEVAGIYGGDFRHRDANADVLGLEHVRDNGSFTLTSGVLAQEPMPGAAAISLANAGLEGFDPATGGHEELMELLRELGSTAKPGGRIPAADMRQYLAAAMDNDLSESSVRGIAAEVRRKFGGAKVAEPKVA